MPLSVEMPRRNKFLDTDSINEAASVYRKRLVTLPPLDRSRLLNKIGDAAAAQIGRSA